MKSTLTLSALFLIALSLNFISCKNSASVLKETEKSNVVRVDVCPGEACCSNLRISDGEKIAGPNACGDKNALYAVNLAEFNLDNISDCNQKIEIEYSLLDDCEAFGEAYHCVIVCDHIHGLPIRIEKLLD